LKVLGWVVAVILLVAVFLPSRSVAWNCSAAESPIDFVVCSKPELLSANAQMEAEFQKAESGQDKRRRRELMQEFRHWIYDVTATCVLPDSGKPSDEVISRSQGCVLGKIEERSAALLKANENLPPQAAPSGKLDL
jgi:uncharacterized protein YecT (DUF1311 family)